MQIVAVIGLIITAGILAFQIGSYFLTFNEEKPKLGIRALKNPYAIIISAVFLTGALLALFFTRLDMGAFRLFLLILLMLAISVVDYKWHRIPDSLTLSLLLQQLIMLFAVEHRKPDWLNIAISLAIFGVLVLFSYLSKWKFGMGDVKLISVFNLTVGVSTTCYSVLLGMIMMASVSGILILAKKRTLKTSVPFAPYFTAGLFLFYLLSSVLL